VPEPEKRRRTGRVILLLLVLVSLGVIGYLSLEVKVSESTGGTSYPFTTTYDVLFPGGESVRVAGIELSAVPRVDGVTLSVNGEPVEIARDETADVATRHGRITVLGMPVLDFEVRIQAISLGTVGDQARCYLAFQTSKQVPSFLIDRLLPSSLQARPV